MADNVLVEPAPRLSEQRLAELLADHWAMRDVALRALPSERDLNVLVDSTHVLKVANPAEDDAVVEMEVAAMAQVAEADPGLPIPVTVPAQGGRSTVRVIDEDGRHCLARLITVVPGAPLEGTVLSVDLAEQVGAVAARTSMALQGFFHPAAGGRDLDWDLRRLATTAERAGAAGHLTAADPLTALVARVSPALAAAAVLPGGVQHADVTLTNVLAGATTGSEVVSGVIDFGDMHHTAAVCDLAVTLTSVLRNTAAEQPVDTWTLADAVLRGYQRHRLLTPPEVEVLGELVLARLATSVLVSRMRAGDHADNAAYITQYDGATDRVLDVLARSSPGELAARLHRLAGTGFPGADGRPVGERRAAVMGGPLAPLFYDDPIHVVRGEGPWLYDDAGHAHLDAYNNVAVVGHADPTVTRAVSLQLSRLNTHSRYLHTGVVELAERLVATMPEGLDTCLFTTSGTEANELAWRIAVAATCGDGALIAEHAYHGSTRWMADLSSNEWPPGHRPSAVGTFEAPVGPSALLTADVAAARVQAAVADLAEREHRPALLLADSGFTSEGVHDAPAAYFQGLLSGAHEAGALYLADEVQVGYGRTGPDLWRFVRGGITPDIVTLGKPMGAGYPIGAVITRRDLADRLAADYEYFSTFAATPVAAAAGLAVLDVLETRRLPERALAVGAHLVERLTALAAGSPHLGEVRGFGLVVGVDVLGGRPVARRVLRGLVERRVLAGLTGQGGDVLKVRPPLVWERRHADLFCDRLLEVLEEELLDLDPLGA